MYKLFFNIFFNYGFSKFFNIFFNYGFSKFMHFFHKGLYNKLQISQRCILPGISWEYEDDRWYVDWIYTWQNAFFLQLYL